LIVAQIRAGTAAVGEAGAAAGAVLARGIRPRTWAGIAGVEAGAAVVVVGGEVGAGRAALVLAGQAARAGGAGAAASIAAGAAILRRVLAVGGEQVHAGPAAVELARRAADARL